MLTGHGLNFLKDFDLKALIFNTEDIAGGAGRMAYRTHKGFQMLGIDSKLCAMYPKQSGDENVIAPSTRLQQFLSLARYLVNAIPMQLLYRNREKTIWSANWVCNRNIKKALAEIAPDIVNLQQVGEGFMSSGDISDIKTPVVWTFHDMWAFTGGCHYAGECDKYMKLCGACPQLHSRFHHDLSRFNFWRKEKAYKKILEKGDMKIVCPNKWMADCVQKSALLKDFKPDIIPYGIDHNVFRPINKKTARDILGLSDKKLILFSAADASDKRKGIQYLVPALNYLQTRIRDAEVMILSSETKKNAGIKYNINYMGRQQNELSLSLIYSAADVVVAPSVQDNSPLVVLESLACGTPCVAFKIGGIPDMIEHLKNGYLVEPFDVEELSHAIEWAITDKTRHAALSKTAREKVEREFTLRNSAEKYLQLFKKLLRIKD